MDVAFDRELILRRLEILPERQDIALHRSQVAEDGQEFCIGLAQTEHDAGLSLQVRANRFGFLQDTEGALVLRPWSHPFIQTRHTLGVVIENIDRRFGNGGNRIFVALKIGGQHFNRTGGVQVFEHVHGLGKMLGTAVRQVISVDRGDNNM